MRSTWLAVGSGCDGLLLSSRNNAAVLPAPLAPLWSSDLVVPFSRRCLASIQSHLTLEAVCDHWRASASLWETRQTVSFEFLHSLLLTSRFICLGSCQASDPQLSLWRRPKSIGPSMPPDLPDLPSAFLVFLNASVISCSCAGNASILFSYAVGSVLRQ